MADLFDNDPAHAAMGMSARFTLDRLGRLALSYVWDRRLPSAAWLMNNPSVAGRPSTSSPGAPTFDQTARRVIHFSKALGAGSATLVNWCPFVATKPAELWDALQGPYFGPALVQENLDAVAAAGEEAEWRLVACGPEGFRRHPEFVRRALHAFMGEGAFVTKWATRPVKREALCLGTSPEGAPLHPLARGAFAIPNDRRPVPWVPAEWPPSRKGPIVYGRT